MALSDTHDDLRAALGGSSEALSRLLERLRPRLVVWVAGQLSPTLKGEVEPEDLVQEILFAVHRDFAGFEERGEGSFYRWLFTLGRNRIRDLADRVGAEKRRARAPISAPSQTTPSGAASRREEVARMLRAMESLPERHREVLLLVKLEERPVDEVAALLRVTPNAVRVLHCRALKELRAALGAEPPQGARNAGPRGPLPPGETPPGGAV